LFELIKLLTSKYLKNTLKYIINSIKAVDIKRLP